MVMIILCICLYSTITAWGRENEVKAFKNMLTQVAMLSFIHHFHVCYAVFKRNGGMC